LLTDFGISDHYVAALKGVILQLCPDAVLVDISHTISRHSVAEGAYVLSQAAPYFPEGSIHLAVVDPGVGTRRRRIVIEGRRCLYVGPDNGLLIPAARAEGIVKTVEITNKRLIRREVSATFEARDVFAPVAAHLASGLSIEDIGPKISNPVELSWGEVSLTPSGATGRVLHIDRFGNIVTNLPSSSLSGIPPSSPLRVRVGAAIASASASKSYGDVPEGKLIVLAGSGGFVEIAVNRGSAQEVLGAHVGAEVELSFSLPTEGDTYRR
jgi:S-adenosylmethionine hydrolase